ncbi:anti-phage BREX system Lon protease BrxL [Clostridium cochlearium]|uniref:anti-phage BREX system Lon protease BrxL n=1 Tax=Clostridium cochlearium TaxID=1494 RepID=UPI001EDE1AEC|nr:anti-phage BREX system Lon protease BrxL [Clostridium cochlearium]MBV1818010.1 hypothetical protein [Bacteroidales bacterium MSK.15.36]MCG4580093.1 hypothetical protein [Clostridium cochlearium]
MYCAIDDEDSINDGVERVKKILFNNFARINEAEKIKSKIKELGQYTVIDNITFKLKEKKDICEAEFSNLGLKGVQISSHYVKDYEKLLAIGIWCILKMDYFYDEEIRDVSTFNIGNLTPIQMPNLGMEPTQLE